MGKAIEGTRDTVRQIMLNTGQRGRREERGGGGCGQVSCRISLLDTNYKTHSSDIFLSASSFFSLQFPISYGAYNRTQFRGCSLITTLIFGMV